jgi:tetratricopeptide (TPR) repeat protein
MARLHQFANRFCCGHRTARSLTAMTLTGAMLLPLVGKGQEHQLPTAASTSARPALLPHLPDELVKEVADCEASIPVALSNLEDIALIDAAIPKAEHVYQIRGANQGEAWWQTIDARQDLADLRRISTMPAEARAGLAAAKRSADSLQVDDLQKAGKNDQGIDALLKAARTEGQLLIEEHRWYAHSLDGLASLDVAMGRNEQAEALYRQALEIEKKTVGEQHPTYATSLCNLGDLYRLMGKYEQAEPLYRQALAIRKKTLGEQHPAYAVNLDNLASLYEAMGRYEDAEALYRQALEIRKKTVGEYHPHYAANLRHLAAILAVTNRTQEASRLLLESAQLQWLHLTKNSPTMSDRQKRQFLAHSRFIQSEELSSLVFQGKGDPKDGLRGVLLSKDLLFEVARQESGALASAVAAAPPAWREQWRQRERLRHQYATVVLQIMSEGGHSQPADRKPLDAAYVRSLAGQIEQLDERLRQSNPAYAATVRVRQVSLEDVSRALRPGEALTEYVRYQPYDFATEKSGSAHYGVFLLLGGSGQVTAIDLGDAKGIDEAVQQFRAAVRGSIDHFKSVEPSRGQIRRSEEEIGLTSSALRELVWQPLEKQLSGNKRVYVAPDGPLSLIPFEALARKDASGGWRYLAEDRELLYLGTGRSLSGLALSAGTTAERPKTAVLIGNPAFSAKPEELAAVEARLSSPTPTPTVSQSSVLRNGSTLVSQSSVPPSASTLGVTGGDNAPRLQIPRNWI